MCDAHSSGEALLSWRLANGDFSQKPIICVQHYKKINVRILTFHPNVHILYTCIIFSNIKMNSNLHKCSSIKDAQFLISDHLSLQYKNNENNNTHSITPRCQVMDSGSMSSLTKRAISSSVNVLGSVFFIPSFYQ